KFNFERPSGIRLAQGGREISTGMRRCRCHARRANTGDLNDRLHVALWVSRSQAMAEEKGCTMMARKRGAAIYVRVSTDKQTVENQVRELRQIAERRGWEIVEQYSDAGISGGKGRDDRPGLDQMLKDAQRRRFDVVMAWAIDRLGRSLIDLLGTIQALE